MKDKTVFCEHCLNEFPYIEKEIPTKEVFKGVECEYISKDTFCTNCGKEILVNEVVDSNIYALYNAYRLKTGLISLEDTRAILKKYKIGKRPFSLLLGWGENTFSNYLEGYLPSKQYSDILKKIYISVPYYNTVLENGKSRITPVAYEKSKREVSKLLGIVYTSNNKLQLATNYLLSKCDGMTHLALQKSLYYAQGFFFAFFGEPFFKDRCEAWSHGPVFPLIYQQYRKYDDEFIGKPEKEVNKDAFTIEELSILNSIIDNFCCYTGSILRNFTHEEAPWQEARENLKNSENSNTLILPANIETFFKGIKEKYNMQTPADIAAYATYMFKNRKHNN